NGQPESLRSRRVAHPGLRTVSASDQRRPAGLSLHFAYRRLGGHQRGSVRQVAVERLFHLCELGRAAGPGAADLRPALPPTQTNHPTASLAGNAPIWTWPGLVAHIYRQTKRCTGWLVDRAGYDHHVDREFDSQWFHPAGCREPGPTTLGDWRLCGRAKPGIADLSLSLPLDNQLIPGRTARQRREPGIYRRACLSGGRCVALPAL